MTLHLLDANVLIALLAPTHEHHESAAAWFSRLTDDDHVATDPTCEGAFIRYAVRAGFTARVVADALDTVHRHPRWAFCPDDVSYAEVNLDSVRGHKQVTDTYLAHLAQAHAGVLITFDRQLAARLPRSTRLLLTILEP